MRHLHIVAGSSDGCLDAERDFDGRWTGFVVLQLRFMSAFARIDETQDIARRSFGLPVGGVSCLDRTRFRTVANREDVSDVFVACDGFLAVTRGREFSSGPSSEESDDGGVGSSR